MDISLNSKIEDEYISHISSLTCLEVLNLSRTSISKDSCQYLKTFTNLRSLDIGNTSIGANGIQLLTSNLNHIYKSPHFFFLALKKVTSFSCAYTTIDNKTLASFQNLPSLKSLKLSFCTYISDDGLAHLGQLTTLTSLDLGSPYITDYGINHLTNLIHLEILTFVI